MIKKYTYELDTLNRFIYLSLLETQDQNIPFVEIESTDFRNIICGYHGLQNGKIVVIGKTEEEENELLNHNKLNHSLPELKKLLANTDYQVIKCYEAQLANEVMPYDIQELLAQRKAWRDKINEIEFEITMLG